ncbi:DUF5320 domain-containing protein [Klebsiella aerogenes]|uniref:DUF5320 domain-containing protein n=1 Tax=Klebsiella aerogenes TaxID=548 RepID=UPI00339C559D
MTSEQRIEVLEKKLEALKKQLEDTIKYTSCSVDAIRADVLALSHNKGLRDVHINCN